MRVPDFVVVGAARSGSSSLFRALAEHPGVFMAQPKELRFFDEHYHRGLDWYRSCFSGAPPDQRAGEASPGYFSDPRALDRLVHDIPGVRVVVILRDPVDRAYSHHWLRRSLREETRSWTEVVACDLEPMHREGVFWPSRYSLHLDRLLTAFGVQRSLVLSFDDLLRTPAALFARVCAFIGVVRTTPASLDRPVNPHLEFRSLALRNVTKGRAIPRRVRNAIGRINNVTKPYSPMPRHIRSHLDAFFEADRDAMREAFAARREQPVDV